MRETKYETKTVERLVLVGEEVKCDFCGLKDEIEVFEVRIEIAADGCAGTRITRDTCQYCYDEKFSPLFIPLFEALEAGKEKHAYRIEEDSDLWYG